MPLEAAGLALPWRSPKKPGPRKSGTSPDSMRDFSSSACSWVILPSSRAWSTWSTAAALVASSSSSEEMPRCFATESRNEEPCESVCEAAIAAPPPATASPATVAARTFFEVSLLMGRVLSVALSHDGTKLP